MKGRAHCSELEPAGSDGKRFQRRGHVAARRVLEELEPPERDRRSLEPDEPPEAERGGGEGGGDGAGAGAVPGAGREPVRPAGYPHHQAQPVPHVLLHEASEHRRPGRGHLPSSPSTHLGHHVPLLRAGHPVQVGEVPAGGRDVRLHLHVSLDVRGQMLGHLSASALPAQRQRSLLRGLLLDSESALQRPADVHLLPQRSRLRRVRGVRLLGRLCETLGRQSIHHLDQPHHLHHSRGHSEHLLRADQLQDLAKLQTENQTGAVHQPDAQNVQKQHAGPREQREAHIQGQDHHGEDDFCHRRGLHCVLDPVLLSPDVVCVGSSCAA